jgi:hypothetical protein
MAGDDRIEHVTEPDDVRSGAEDTAGHVERSDPDRDEPDDDVEGHAARPPMRPIDASP